MTREEWLKRCKERAIAEMDFTKDPKQALISMAADLRKHPETNNEGLISLTMEQLLINPRITRQEVIKFLDGFN